MTDEQLASALLLVLEMDGSDGVADFVAAHGLDQARCRRLLASELSPLPQRRRSQQPERNR
jgi:hypothetical protein